MTVGVDSIAENEESMPSKRSMNPSNKDKEFYPTMVLIAVGYETKAIPTPVI